MRYEITSIDGEVETSLFGAGKGWNRMQSGSNKRDRRVAIVVCQRKGEGGTKAEMLPEVCAKPRGRENRLVRTLGVEVVLATAQSRRAVCLRPVSIAYLPVSSTSTHT